MLSLYRECSETQKNGAKIPVYDAHFWVARMGSKETIDQLKDIKTMIYGIYATDDDVDYNVIHAHWLAEHGVKGWNGVIDIDEKTEIKYSTQEARRIFLNPEYFMSLNKVLIESACVHENFLHKEAYGDTEDLKKK